MSSLLAIRGITKSFGAVKALVGVDLDIREGEVHALIGENGAGKSTLMKVLSGAHRPDSGEIEYRGEAFSARNPSLARRAGIAMIYQELMLAPHLSVEENIMLGIEVSRGGWLRHQGHRVSEVLEWMGHGHVDPDTPVNQLSISIQQVVEIARALVGDAKVIIMDEPTSSLTSEDTQALFRMVRRLRDRGVAVIYISHFLEEIKEVCDRYTVLRDGATVATGVVADASIRDLIEKMVGRSLEEMYPRTDHAIGEEIMSVEDLVGMPLPSGVSFSLREGEILGVAGLVGAGRSESVRCLFGLNRAYGGRLKLRGRDDVDVRALSPPRSLARDVDLLSENRKEEGLATDLAITTNVTLSGLRRYARWGFVNLVREGRSAVEWCGRLGVKCRRVGDPVSSLSGGNQQKVAIARLLHHDCDVLLLDEPTRGIDVGSKAEVYRLIHELGGQGKAIVMVSSYLPELLGICDSLVVMHRGAMSEKRPISEWSEHDIMLFATAGRTEEGPSHAEEADETVV
jgi:ribose transport system ATP-binding protein